MRKVIIFDGDGVVINKPMIFSRMWERDYGITIDMTIDFFKGIFQECLVGKADLKEVMTPYLAGWGWEGTMDELLKYWFEAEHYVDERVVEYITKARAQDVECYLATNQEKYRTEYMKTQMGFDALFDGIYSSADVGFKKPERDFYDAVHIALGISDEDQVVFWDDDKENVAAANDFGWQSFFFESFDDFTKKMNDLDLAL